LKLLDEVISAVRKATTLPLIVKLSPNVTKIGDFAKAAEGAGADAVSLINTITGMAINAETRRPRIANLTGGLSGPAVKPVALRMVYEASKAVKIPVIGMGGICDGIDAVEFMLAGASAVAVGTATFVDPYAPLKVIDGIEDYLRRHNYKSVSEIVGALEV
jgi:dihydroorotate dehydrogenase (NAD+) catalytic subunit